MLFFILFTLAISHGSVLSSEANEVIAAENEIVEESICDKNIFESCRFERMEKFPETREEVDELCSKLVPFHHCISEFLTECDIDEETIPFRGIFDSGAIISLCSTGSPQYNILTENIKCLKDSLDGAGRRGFCSKHIEILQEETPDIVEKLQEMIPGFSEDESERKLARCLETVLEIGCTATNLKNSCGEDALHLFLYLIEKSNMANHVCKEEHRSSVGELVELMKFKLRK